MTLAHATIRRQKKRALRFAFLFDEHQIPDPELWLMDRIGMDVDMRIHGPSAGPIWRKSGIANLRCRSSI
jgi:hypothetical protein